MLDINMEQHFRDMAAFSNCLKYFHILSQVILKYAGRRGEKEEGSKMINSQLIFKCEFATYKVHSVTRTSSGSKFQIHVNTTARSRV